MNRHLAVVVMLAGCAAAQSVGAKCSNFDYPGNNSLSFCEVDLHGKISHTIMTSGEGSADVRTVSSEEYFREFEAAVNRETAANKARAEAERCGGVCTETSTVDETAVVERAEPAKTTPAPTPTKPARRKK